MANDERFESAGIDGLFDLSFRRFITLNVIKVLYGLGLLVIALGWLIAVIGGFSNGVGPGLLMLIVGTLVALLYVIFYRVWLELIVVLFRIGENTSRLVEQNDAGGPPPTA